MADPLTEGPLEACTDCKRQPLWGDPLCPKHRAEKQAVRKGQLPPKEARCPYGLAPNCQHVDCPTCRKDDVDRWHNTTPMPSGREDDLQTCRWCHTSNLMGHTPWKHSCTGTRAAGAERARIVAIIDKYEGMSYDTDQVLDAIRDETVREGELPERQGTITSHPGGTQTRSEPFDPPPETKGFEKPDPLSDPYSSLGEHAAPGGTTQAREEWERSHRPRRTITWQPKRGYPSGDTPVDQLPSPSRRPESGGLDEAAEGEQDRAHEDKGTRT